MTDWTCSDCRVTNAGPTRLCEQCGAARPVGGKSAAPPVTASRLDCTGCGAQLRADGWCARGQGYSGHLVHQGVVCPDCRGPITFDGVCRRCQPPTRPGDYYAWEAGHWVLEARGPGRWATAETAAASIAAIKARLARVEAREVPPVTAADLAEERRRWAGEPVAIGGGRVTA